MGTWGTEATRESHSAVLPLGCFPHPVYWFPVAAVANHLQLRELAVSLPRRTAVCRQRHRAEVQVLAALVLPGAVRGDPVSVPLSILVAPHLPRLRPLLPTSECIQKTLFRLKILS